MDVQYYIHRHGLTDEEAFLVESVLIDAYPHLTNLQGGHDGNDLGCKTAEDIVIMYDLPELAAQDLKHRLVLIKVNSYQDPFAHLKDRTKKSSDDPRNMLDQVRFAWTVDAKRAEQADYVLAVWRGIVVGAYVATAWLPATREHFGAEFGHEFTDDEAWEKLSKRKGFKGKDAPEEIWRHYVGDLGKQIVEEGAKHDQFPIRYWQPQE